MARKRKPPICPDCQAPARIVKGGFIYPHRPDLFGKPYWQCPTCDARVGCHPGTKKPLGTLANPALRKARRAAYAAFDTLWRAQGKEEPHAYRWLAKKLRISHDVCHFARFNAGTCAQVVALCTSLTAALAREQLEP